MYRLHRIVVLGAATVLAALFWNGTAAAQGPLCGGQPVTLEGTAGDDHLIGTPGNDVILGLQGDDVIEGLGGDDIICAGKGDDVVRGGAGFDIIFGAQGRDTLYAAEGEGLEARSDVRGARMFGGQDDDVLHGSNRWDRMQGGPGNDRFLGFEGRDWIRGGPGADQIDGGRGVDDLHGGNGPDRIRVTSGDVVRGGAGRDFCDVTGEAGLLRSCGENLLEPARQPAAENPGAPVAPVTEAENSEEEEPRTITTPILVPGENGAPQVDEEGREPGSDTPDYDEALASAELTGPCDLFSAEELRQIVVESAGQSGAFDALPAGFGDGSDLEFLQVSTSNTTCDWFSDSYIWFVGVSFQPADPTYTSAVFAGQETFGTGFQASVVSDASAQVVASDLYVYIDNLMPGGASTASDRAITRALAEAIGARLTIGQ